MFCIIKINSLWYLERRKNDYPCWNLDSASYLERQSEALISSEKLSLNLIITKLVCIYWKKHKQATVKLAFSYYICNSNWVFPLSYDQENLFSWWGLGSFEAIGTKCDLWDTPESYLEFNSWISSTADLIHISC